MLWARINGKAVEAMTLWCGMESVGFDSEIFKRSIVPFPFLNFAEGGDDRPLRSPGFYHPGDRSCLGSQESL
jgi:hypothetical protein